MTPVIHIGDMYLSEETPYCIQINSIFHTFFSYLPFNPNGRIDDEIIAIWKIKYKNL